MSKPRPVRVTYDVAKDEEYNYFEKAVPEGTIFYTFHKSTYGCVDDEFGIALSERPNEYPFFEFPRNAVEFVDA